MFEALVSRLAAETSSEVIETARGLSGEVAFASGLMAKDSGVALLFSDLLSDLKAVLDLLATPEPTPTVRALDASVALQHLGLPRMGPVKTIFNSHPFGKIAMASIRLCVAAGIGAGQRRRCKGGAGAIDLERQPPPAHEGHPG